MKYKGIIDDLDIQEYHFTDAKSAHNLMDFILWCGEGSVSQDEIPIKETPAMLEGSLIHHMIQFQEYESRYALAPDVDRRTKAGKAEFAEFESQLGHRKAISRAQLDMAKGCMDAAWSHPVARLFLENGKMERSGFCEIMGLPVKARPDIDCSHIPASDNFPALVDIKTRKVRAANEDAWLKDFYHTGLYIQAGLQILVWRELGYHVDEYFHLLVERGSPYCVNVIKLPPAWKSVCILQVHSAIEKWKSWLSNGSPKSYGLEMKTLAFPDWMEMKLAI